MVTRVKMRRASVVKMIYILLMTMFRRSPIRETANASVAAGTANENTKLNKKEAVLIASSFLSIVKSIKPGRCLSLSVQ